MKKLLILFIILVPLMTFILTRDAKIDKTNIVTPDDITNYKQIVINTHNKYGWELSEKELNNSVQELIDAEISRAEIKAQGMEFGEALKFSIFFSLGCCLVILILIVFFSSHYGELYHHHELTGTSTSRKRTLLRKNQ